MPKFRVEKNKNYTTIANYHLKDKKISLKAKGLLSYMLSLPDNWDYSIEGLAKINKESAKTIKTVLDELKDNDYLSINKVRNSKGQYEYEYLIYEKPYTQKPGVDNPPVDEPGVESYRQINTKEQNTKEYTPYNPPKGNEGVDELFNLFWKSYPKKVSKGNAEKWFKKNKPTKELVDTMISKIDLLKETEQWKKSDGQFIPYPATWLNAKGWEDEIKSSNTNNFKKPTKGFIPNKIVTFDNGAKGYFDEEGKVHYT